jgi:hypothetical protein
MVDESSCARKADRDGRGVGLGIRRSAGARRRRRPGEPGWSLPAVCYHTSADAGSDKSFALGGRVTAGIDATGDLVFFFPTYVFGPPAPGGQVALAMGVGGGRLKVRVDATLSRPLGNLVSGAETDTRDGFADLYPTLSVKWNFGLHNLMTYAMAGIPVGTYSAGRLANLGTNHWSLDGGAGYTYLDAKKGHEFSAVLGMTYNFENHDTDYRNGNDLHLDWAASQFFSESVHAGLVGYYYQQLSGDSGSGAKLGDFKSRVAAIGPQVGDFFKVDGRKWYANLKGYYEFDAKNRPEGWNTWISVEIPLGAV